jgi:Kef-type K+ transport system membrane component KefB
MKLVEAKKPESVIDVLAVLLLGPAIAWIIAVCWVFGRAAGSSRRDTEGTGRIPHAAPRGGRNMKAEVRP